jgi:two-component system, sporulation sensor kinase E
MEKEAVNILMVDDRVENLLTLEAVLKSPEYCLISATSGEEALKWVLKKDFAVILLDVQMPGIDGFETAKLIRAREKSKDIPIIFLTALSQTQEHVMNGYSVGAIDYMFKPFPPQVLQSKVAGFVKIYQSQKQIQQQYNQLDQIIQKRTEELFISNQNLQKEIEVQQKLWHELYESEEKYRLLVEESPEAIFVQRLDSVQWSFINKTGVHLLGGTSLKDIEGKNLEEFIHPFDKPEILEKFKEVRLGKKVGTFNGRILTLNDETVDVQIKCIPFIYKSIPSLHIVVRDVTELNQSREFIQRSERLAVAGELAAGIAHEVRNPLTSLRGFTQLLEFQTSSKTEYVSIMLSEIDRINTIVSELLLLAKPSKIDFQKVELYQLLHNIMILMSAQANLHGVEIKLDCHDKEEYIVFGIENKLKQVFINFLKNAIEAMPDGGVIMINMEKTEGRISILFIDQGMGMPREILERVGRPFFTTKETGTGLGIMVCQSIIESHQGNMTIESEEGKGTTIKVSLKTYV